ncbi:MAG: nitroreductase family protein [Clostridia bacterium]|nr:nitroreductase family protein [Clostridia bacterium]
MENEVLKCLKERRSIKSYDNSRKVGDTELSLILEAGTYAPTGRNRQSPVMVAVRNADVIDEMSKINAEILGASSDPFYSAPCVIVVFADTNVNTAIEDASLVMGNLLNAAHSLGLGACWVHRAKETFETEKGRALMKKWGLGDNYVGVGNCILGYRNAEMPATRPRKEDYIIRVD